MGVRARAIPVTVGIALRPACTVASVLMPEEAAITLYVKPYISKFVVARLARIERFDATSWQLQKMLQAQLRHRVLNVVNTYVPSVDKPIWKVIVMVEHDARFSLDPTQDRRQHINLELNKAFMAEMFQWVDFYRSLGNKARVSLELFRRHYSITEEDHHFHSAERLYQLYCQRTGKSRPYRRRSVRIRRSRVK